MKYIHSVYTFSIFIFLFIASACSSNEALEGNTQDALSSFLNGNEKVVSFGNANLKSIMDKAEFENVPKFGVLIKSEMATLEKYIDMKMPVYYALEGPINDNGPETTYAFVSINNVDSLAKELTYRGFVMSEKGEMKYTEDGDFAIGVKGNLGIIVTSQSKFEGEALLTSAFSKTENSPSEGRIDEILNTDGDIVMGVSLENLYATSETDLNDLSEEKQKEMKTMVANSYVSTSFKFEDGAAIIETSNYFSDELKARMFMRSDENASIIAKLGSGEPKLGISMNVDIEKMQNFVDEFSPDATMELARSMGGMASMAVMTAGPDGFASIFNGKFGLMLFGEDDEFGSTPEFSLYVGLESKGHKIVNDWQDFIRAKIKDLNLEKDGVSAYSTPEIAKTSGLKLPKGCENFGKSGMSAFVSFDGIDAGEITFGEEKYLLRVIDYVTLDYNNEGGRIYIKAKKGQENILKEMMDSVLEGLSDDISKIAI